MSRKQVTKELGLSKASAIRAYEDGREELTKEYIAQLIKKGYLEK